MTIILIKKKPHRSRKRKILADVPHHGDGHRDLGPDVAYGSHHVGELRCPHAAARWAARHPLAARRRRPPARRRRRRLPCSVPPRAPPPCLRRPLLPPRGKLRHAAPFPLSLFPACWASLQLFSCLFSFRQDWAGALAAGHGSGVSLSWLG